MPDADADALRAMFEHWGRGDFTTAPALFAPDMRFSAAQPEGQVQDRGPEGVKRFMKNFLPQWEDWRMELESLEELAPGRFLADVRQLGRGNASGVNISAPGYVAISMRGGRMTQLEIFFEREPALAALREPL